MTTPLILLILSLSSFCCLSINDYVKSKSISEQKHTIDNILSMAEKYRERAQQYLKVCQSIESKIENPIIHKQYNDAMNNYVFYVNMAEKLERSIGDHTEKD